MNIETKARLKNAFKLGRLGLYGAAIGAASLAMVLEVEVKPADQALDAKAHINEKADVDQGNAPGSQP